MAKIKFHYVRHVVIWNRIVPTLLWYSLKKLLLPTAGPLLMVLATGNWYKVQNLKDAQHRKVQQKDKILGYSI